MHNVLIGQLAAPARPAEPEPEAACMAAGRGLRARAIRAQAVLAEAARAIN